ncbi:MAG: DUF3159 domain-containing protein [Mycobacteriales bacterium]|nr:MAG: DUF3159 domain-containing protein [Pseudonocardiales bacterium]
MTPAAGDRPSGSTGIGHTAREVPERGPLVALMLTSIGGWRGMLDSGLPVVVFVIVNTVAALHVAIWSAVGAGMLICALRLVRRQSPQQAFGGLFAVAIAALIAARTGQARGFFLLGIWRNYVYGGVLLISVLIRRPLIGLAWEYAEGHGTAWRRDRPTLWRYTWLTLMWVAVFGSRAIVQQFFYQKNATGWLAATSLAMGYPLFVLAAGSTVLVVTRARRRAVELASTGQQKPS